MEGVPKKDKKKPTASVFFENGSQFNFSVNTEVASTAILSCNEYSTRLSRRWMH